MTVAQLFTDIRYQMSDELKSGYTDTELIGLLNQVNEYVYTTLIDHGSNMTQKKATVTLTSGVGSLPSDFELDEAVKVDELHLTAVAPSITPTSTQYNILGDEIYSDNDSLTLYYYYMPDSYTTTTATLTIPTYFQNLYRQMIKFLALNSDEFDTSIEQALMNRFESTILSMAGKRGNVNPRAVMPFKV